MPHLQFETTADADDAAVERFTDRVTELYAEHMDTGTGHVAVTVRRLPDAELALGRLGPGEDPLVLNADVRRGRSDRATRGFVEAAFEAAAEHLGVPPEHAYAVLTGHAGDQFHEHDRVLPAWDDSEAEEGV